MNRSQFQRAIGVAYSTILNWERGRTRPNAEHLRLISRVTGASISELLGQGVDCEPRAPAYPALGQFLASELATGITPDERRTLEGIRFHGMIPTVGTFHAILVGMRMGTRVGKHGPSGVLRSFTDGRG